MPMPVGTDSLKELRILLKTTLQFEKEQDEVLTGFLAKNAVHFRRHEPVAAKPLNALSQVANPLDTLSQTARLGAPRPFVKSSSKGFQARSKMERQNLLKSGKSKFTRDQIMIEQQLRNLEEAVLRGESKSNSHDWYERLAEIVSAVDKDRKAKLDAANFLGQNIAAKKGDPYSTLQDSMAQFFGAIGQNMPTALTSFIDGLRQSKKQVADQLTEAIQAREQTEKQLNELDHKMKTIEEEQRSTHATIKEIAGILSMDEKGRSDIIQFVRTLKKSNDELEKSNQELDTKLKGARLNTIKVQQEKDSIQGELEKIKEEQKTSETQINEISGIFQFGKPFSLEAIMGGAKQFKEQIETVTREKEELAKTQQTTAQKIKDLQEQLDESNANLKKSAEDSAQLNEELGQQRSNLLVKQEKLVDDRKSATAEIEKLTKLNEDLKKKLNEAQTTSKSQASEIGELNTKITINQAELNILTKFKEDLEKQLQENQTLLEQKKTDAEAIENKFKQQQEELQENLLKKTDEATVLEAELRTQLKKIEAEKEMVEKKLSDELGSKGELSLKIEGLIEELKILKNQVNQLNISNDILRKQQRTQVKELIKKLYETTQILNKFKEKPRGGKLQQRQEAKSKLDNSQKIQNKERVINQLEQKIAALENDKEELTKTILSENLQLGLIKKELDEARKKHAVELDAKVQQRKGLKISMNSILEIQRIAIAELKTSNRQLAEERKKLFEAKRTLAEQLTGQEEINSTMKETQTKLIEKVNNSKQANNELQEQLKIEKAALSVEKQRHVAQMEPINLEIKNQKNQNELLSSEVNELKRDKEGLKQELTELMSANEGLEGAIEEKEKIIAASKTGVASLQKKLVSSEKEKNELTSILSSERSQVRDLKSQLGKKQTRIDQLVQVNNAFKGSSNKVTFVVAARLQNVPFKMNSANLLVVALEQRLAEQTSKRQEEALEFKKQLKLQEQSNEEIDSLKQEVETSLKEKEELKEKWQQEIARIQGLLEAEKKNKEKQFKTSSLNEHTMRGQKAQMIKQITTLLERNAEIQSKLSILKERKDRDEKVFEASKKKMTEELEDLKEKLQEAQTARELRASEIEQIDAKISTNQDQLSKITTLKKQNEQITIFMKKIISQMTELDAFKEKLKVNEQQLKAIEDRNGMKQKEIKSNLDASITSQKEVADELTEAMQAKNEAEAKLKDIEEQQTTTHEAIKKIADIVDELKRFKEEQEASELKINGVSAIFKSDDPLSLKEIENKVNDLERKNEELIHRNEQLEKTNTEVTQEIEKLRDELNILNASSTNSTENAAQVKVEFEQQLLELSTQKTKLATANKSLEQDLQELKDKCQVHTSNIKREMEQNNALEVKQLSLEQELVFLKKENSLMGQSKQQIITEHEKEKVELEKKLREANDMIAEQTKNVNEADKNVEAKNKELLTLQIQLERSTKQLEEQNKSILQTKEQLEKEHEERKAANGKQLIEIVRIQETLNNEQRKNSELTKLQRRRQQDTAQVKGQLDSKKEIEQQLEMSNQKQSEMQIKLDELSRENERMDDFLAKIKGLAYQIPGIDVGELDNDQNILATIKTKFDSLVKENTDLKQSVQKEMSDLNKLRLELAEKSSKLTTITEENKTLQKDLEKLAQGEETLLKESTELQLKLSILKGQKDISDQAFETLKIQITEESDNLTNRLQEAQITNETQASKIEQLEIDISMKQNSLDYLNKLKEEQDLEIKNFQGQVASQTIELNAAREELKANEHQLKEQDLLKVKFETDLETLTKKLADTEEHLKKKENEITDMSNQTEQKPTATNITFKESKEKFEKTFELLSKANTELTRVNEDFEGEKKRSMETQKKLAEVQEREADLMASLQTTKILLKQKETVAEAVENELKKLKAEKETLATNLSDELVLKNKVSLELNQLKDTNKTLSENNSAQNVQLELREKEIDKARNEHTVELDSKVKQWEDIKTLLDNTLGTQTIEIAELKTANQKFITQIEKITREHEQISETNITLTKQLADQEGKTSIMEEKMEKTKQANKELHKQLEMENNAWNIEKAHFNSELESQKIRHKESQLEVETLEQHKKSTEAELAELKKENEVLKRVLEEKEKSVIDLGLEIASLKEKLITIQKENNKLTETIIKKELEAQGLNI